MITSKEGGWRSRRQERRKVWEKSLKKGGEKTDDRKRVVGMEEFEEMGLDERKEVENRRGER